MNYTLLVFNKFRVKPEGEDITEISACEERAKCKSDFSNALTCGLFAA
jgi:hypothetical protein